MNELYELADRHVFGETSPEEDIRLRELLQNKDNRAAFVRHMTLIAAVRDHCAAAEQMEAEGRRMKVAEPVQREIPRPWAIRHAKGLALAAGLLVLLGAGVILHHESAVAASGQRISFVKGVAWTESGSDGAPPKTIVSGSVIGVGARIRTAARSQVALALSDGSHIKLGEKSDFRLSAEHGEARATHTLASGRIECRDFGKPTGNRAILATPHATIDRLGTALTLSVTTNRTRLVVTEGKVRVARLADSATSLVASGYTCDVSASVPSAGLEARAPVVLPKDDIAFVPVPESVGIKIDTDRLDGWEFSAVLQDVRLGGVARSSVKKADFGAASIVIGTGGWADGDGRPILWLNAKKTAPRMLVATHPQLSAASTGTAFAVEMRCYVHMEKPDAQGRTIWRYNRREMIYPTSEGYVLKEYKGKSLVHTQVTKERPRIDTVVVPPGMELGVDHIVVRELKRTVTDGDITD